MIGLVSSVFSFFTRVLPLLFAYKSGKDKAKQEQLEEVIEDVNEANKIENDVDRATDSDVINRLRRWRRDI
jgi:hypothetical protein